VKQKIPDYFANVKIKNPEKILQYRKMKPEGVPEIPEHYVKYIE